MLSDTASLPRCCLSPESFPNYRTSGVTVWSSSTKVTTYATAKASGSGRFRSTSPRMTAAASFCPQRHTTKPTLISPHSCVSSCQKTKISAFARRRSSRRWVRQSSSDATSVPCARWPRSRKASMPMTGATSCASIWCGARAVSFRTTTLIPTTPLGGGSSPLPTARALTFPLADQRQ